MGKITHLEVLLLNDSCWSGKFDIVERVFIIESQLKSIFELDAYLSTPAMRRVLENSVNHFKGFRSVFVLLKKQGMDLREVWFALDEICKDYQNMEQ